MREVLRPFLIISEMSVLNRKVLHGRDRAHKPGIIFCVLHALCRALLNQIHRDHRQTLFLLAQFWDFLTEAPHREVYTMAQIMDINMQYVHIQYVKCLCTFTCINIYSKKALHTVRGCETLPCFSNACFCPAGHKAASLITARLPHPQVTFPLPSGS